MLVCKIPSLWSFKASEAQTYEIQRVPVSYRMQWEVMLWESTQIIFPSIQLQAHHHASPANNKHWLLISLNRLNDSENIFSLTQSLGGFLTIFRDPEILSFGKRYHGKYDIGIKSRKNPNALEMCSSSSNKAPDYIVSVVEYTMPFHTSL